MALGFLDRILGNKTPELPEQEQRSVTSPGIVLANWDAAFGVGREVDKLSIVYGCINLRASTIASLPVQLNRQTDQGHKPAKDHPYYKLITQTPNQFQTTHTFWHWVITQLDLFGNAYIQKLRRNNGLVAELIPLNPVGVTIDIQEDGKPYYKMTLTSPDGKTCYQEFGSDQIIHIKGYSRNGIFGLSVIDAFSNLFSSYRELEVAGTAIAKNAAKPNGVLKHPGNLREEDLNKLKSTWTANFAGNNSGTTAFLPSTYTWEAAPGGINAQQAEIVNQKTFTAQRIVADIFGCPLHRSGLTNSPTFASVEEQNRSFLTQTLRPIIVNVEQQLQKQLLDDDDSVYINFDVSEWTRGDAKTRLEWYKFALLNGVLTRNQINQWEGTGYYIPPEKGGDEYILPLNVGVAGQTAQQPDKSASN